MSFAQFAQRIIMNILVKYNERKKQQNETFRDLLSDVLLSCLMRHLFIYI